MLVPLVLACVVSACGGGSSTSAGSDAEALAADTPGTQTPEADTTQRALAVGTDPAWVTVANENQSFTITGTQTVRYGSGSRWATLAVTGGGVCSNAAFGRDPATGVVKVCQVAAASSPTWTKIAAENVAFSVSGTRTVRYGGRSSWITKAVTTSGTCSNGYFGADPLPNVVKECDLEGAGGTVTTPPVTTPPVSTPPTTAGVCTPAISAASTSAVAATVGNGSAASCTGAALQAAINANGVVRFNCGAGTATIAINATLVVPTTRDTVIDGENRIVLDGGSTTRILSLTQNNYRTNPHGLTLQHIVLRNGKAPGGGYVAPNPGNPSCSYGYATGGGAAILLRDATLHVIDVDFQGNAAATPGPDVGGGAISALGSLDVTITGSRFTANSGSNGGALAMLNSNLRIDNSAFSGNSASGVGQNYQSSAVASCPGVGQPGQGGSGGNGGAASIDGGDDTDVIVCGTTFSGNHANELGGALFRTPDIAPRRTTIDRSAFQGNTAKQAGALFVMNSVPLEIFASTFSGNSATTMGAAQVSGSQLNIVNSTFAGNTATHGVGGALFLSGSAANSSILNTTFAGNASAGGAGYFSAAIFGDSNFPIRNTVFSANTTGDAYNPMQCTFSPASGANDLQWPRTRTVGGATDTPCVTGIAFADPLLGALADNTGATQTLLPAATSPLRNAGRNCPSTDQRGKARNAASCTIGAVE